MLTVKPVIAFAALSSILLAGCGAPHLRTVQAAKSQLVGEDVAVLSRCIGEPLDVRAAAGAPLTSRRYSSAQARSADGLLLATPAPAAQANARACVFDFAVENAQIVSVSSDNRAGWGFGSIKNCSAVVERCVSD